MDENIINFVIITVPADGLAPLGARPSEDIVITKCIHQSGYQRVQ